MKSKLASMLLTLSMAVALAVPAFAADANQVFDINDAGQSDVKLTVVDGEYVCEHEGIRYFSNHDGTHGSICSDCGEVLVRSEDHVDLDGDNLCDYCEDVVQVDCEHDSVKYQDNKDGTHRIVCEVCGVIVESNAEHTDVDEDGFCDDCSGELDVPSPILIATVPLQLPVIMSTNGDITVSESAEIVNNQERGITVTGIFVTGMSGWTVVQKDVDFTVKPNDTKQFAISFRGDDVNVLRDGNWNIAGNGALKLNMAVNMPKQTALVSNQTIARVGFVLDWADGVSTSDASAGAGEQARINQANKDADAKFANKMLIFNDFVRFVQSDNDYYQWGRPSQAGIIEDMCAYMGVKYESSTNGSVGSMHDKNLNNLRSYIESSATRAQLQVMIDVTNGGSIPRR